MDLKRTEDTAEELAARLEIEKKRLDFIAASMRAQIAAQEAEIERLRGLERFQQEYVASMRVTAGHQRRAPRAARSRRGSGSTPATGSPWSSSPAASRRSCASPRRRPRTSSSDSAPPSTPATAIIEGRVVRIDPAVENGTVTVDVALDGELPRGARPDLSVDGTIEIERLDDVLYVGRPAYGQAESTVGSSGWSPTGSTPAGSPCSSAAAR